MKTFQSILHSLCKDDRCRFIVKYPDGRIRSQIYEKNTNIDWVDETRCEGVHVKISTDVYYDVEYKCGEWELAAGKH